MKKAKLKIKNVRRRVARKPKRNGRPTDYRVEYADQGYNYALLGATDEDMAGFFGVTVQTLLNWKAKHPRFLGSIKRGKSVADGNVAGTLYKKAMGFRVPAVKIFQKDGVSFEHEFDEYHPPDTTAAIFWLKNRQPKLWRDKQEHALSNPDGSNLIPQAEIEASRMIAEMLYEKQVAAEQEKLKVKAGESKAKE